jgi:hypothetical protein
MPRRCWSISQVITCTWFDDFTGAEGSPTAVGSFAIDPVTGQLSLRGNPFETASHNSYPSLAVVP